MKRDLPQSSVETVMSEELIPVFSYHFCRFSAKPLMVSHSWLMTLSVTLAGCDNFLRIMISDFFLPNIMHCPPLANSYPLVYRENDWKTVFSLIQFDITWSSILYLFIYLIIYFLKFFWPSHTPCGILVP